MEIGEARQLIRDLGATDVTQIGSPSWTRQHDALRRLTTMAQLQARCQEDEWVVDLLHVSGKMDMLITDLLSHEAWCTHVLPSLLEEAQASECSTVHIALYSLQSHSGVLAALLEVAFFHEKLLEDSDEDLLLELGGWCVRRLVDAQGLGEGKGGEDQATDGPTKETAAGLDLAGLQLATYAITIVRYLVDHGCQSAPSLLTHLMDTLDLLHLTCRLLLAPPWRDAPSGRAFQDGAWRPVPPPNRRALLPQEVQAWLTVHGAVRDEGVRARLDATPARRAALCALGPPLGDGVLAQMPVLRPLHAFLAALDTWGGAPGTGRAAAARAAPRVAPLSRASVAATLRGVEWGAARRAARAHVLCPAAGEALRQRLPTLAAALEAACEAQEATGVQGKTCPPGKLSVRLEVYRLAKESAWGWWATYDYVANDEPCQEVQPSEGQRGRRQVLALQAGAGGGEPRALPARGKIVVMTEGRLPMEAGFTLPASESKNTAALEPVLWLTVGRLAEGGAVLQLQLSRLDQPRERDLVTGTWYPYIPGKAAWTLEKGQDSTST
ncbi:ZMY10 [Auxenochlorella protothecoides x Auxenochlorella symbiontica]